MPLRRFLIVSAAVLALALGGIAGAEEDKRSTAKPTAPQIKRGGAAQSEGKSTVAPFKGELRLTPSGQRGAAAVRLVRPIKFDGIKKQFNELSVNAAEYEYGVSAMPQIAKACSEKAYSVQEQKAAGCTGSETLDQCMDKLYKHCVADWSFEFTKPGDAYPGLPGRGGGSVSHSTKQFKKAAEAAAAQARALSQALNQYANQAEQNAKAFSP